MANFLFHNITKTNQYLISIGLISVVSILCYFLSPFIGYKVVALLLLVTVSLTAMFFDIAPVLCAAILSALIWDFFFIPPKLTFLIASTEDILIFFMYFIIAMVNAALTFKIRAIEKETNKKEEKENTLKLYNTLLNSLSHELRTPIATIIGASDNLQADNHKLSDSNKAELVSEISKASLRLNRQVENLLNMSRLESDVIQIKKDWCDINELVHEVVNRLHENLEERVVTITIDEHIPLCKLDFCLMEQVLQNLILNAHLYTEKKCIISIEAAFVNENLILTVEDNGKGFPSDEIGNVFEKFYRLKHSKTGGTGLGLSIVKGFVEAHNGTIRLENRLQSGAKFTVEIPAETTHLNHLKND